MVIVCAAFVNFICLKFYFPIVIFNVYHLSLLLQTTKYGRIIIAVFHIWFVLPLFIVLYIRNLPVSSKKLQQVEERDWQAR